MKPSDSSWVDEIPHRSATLELQHERHVFEQEPFGSFCGTLAS